MLHLFHRFFPVTPKSVYHDLYPVLRYVKGNGQGKVMLNNKKNQAHRFSRYFSEYTGQSVG